MALRGWIWLCFASRFDLDGMGGNGGVRFGGWRSRRYSHFMSQPCYFGKIFTENGKYKITLEVKVRKLFQNLNGEEFPMSC